MSKKGVIGVTTVAIIIGILFIMLYLAGFTIGTGITTIISRIPPLGWLIIMLFIFFFAMGGKKK